MNEVHFLVVDDYPDIIYLVEQKLIRNFENVKIMPAINIKSAEDVLKYRVDVVICDYHLGFENGLDLLDVCARLPNPPLFILFSSDPPILVSNVMYPKFFKIKKPDTKKLMETVLRYGPSTLVPLSDKNS